MKFVFAIGFAALLGVGYYFVDQYRTEHSPEAEHAAWKHSAIEQETAVRPERFAAMKWNPNDPKPEVEMRGPASVAPAKIKKPGKRKKK